jgi:hypothetical protein
MHQHQNKMVKQLLEKYLALVTLNQRLYYNLQVHNRMRDIKFIYLFFVTKREIPILDGVCQKQIIWVIYPHIWYIAIYRIDIVKVIANYEEIFVKMKTIKEYLFLTS